MDLDTDADVTTMPGVGLQLSKRLNSQGIHTVGDLKEQWEERERDPVEMKKYLSSKMIGIPSIAVNKLVKMVKQEFGA